MPLLMKFTRFLIFLFLTACAPFTTVAPPPTRQAVRASLPPALRTWGSRLQACAAKDPGTDLFVEEKASSDPAAGQADVAFHLVQPPGPIPASLVQVGAEDIVLLVNAGNPVEKLSQAQLGDLFAGKITRWEALAPAPKGFTGEVQVWTYPASEELRRVFESALFHDGNSQAQPMLAPDPQAMLEAIASSEMAIGYAPMSWLKTLSPDLEKNLKQVQLEPALSQALHAPVLAASAAEPQGAVRALLVCLEQK